MSKALFVSALASLMLLGGCVREGSGSVPMRGGIDAASAHHSDAVPQANVSTFEARQGVSSAPAGEHAPRRSNIRY